MSLETTSSWWERRLDKALILIETKLNPVIIVVLLLSTIYSQYELTNVRKELTDSYQYSRLQAELNIKKEEENRKFWRDNYFIMLQIIPWINYEKSDSANRPTGSTNKHIGK